MPRIRIGRRVWRWVGALAAAVILLLVVPLGVGLTISYGEWSGTSNARHERRGPSGQAPDPAATPEAVVQVYAGRAARWRGAVGVHSWIAVKRSGADHYTRYEIWSWRRSDGQSMVRAVKGRADDYWYGYRPDKLADLRGPGVDRVIDRIEAAVAVYPDARRYRIWPGPNSNSFIAHIGRAAPELKLDLPPTAIGKDYLGDGTLVAPAPSGTGYQFSINGLTGILVAWEEGIEINLFGLVYGIDPTAPALKLPGVGRLGWR